MQILFIDMVARAATAQRQAIANAGHVVLAACGAAEAIDLAAAYGVDALVLACGTADAALWHVAHQLKTAHPRTPLVMVVEHADTGTVTRLIEAGADDVLVRAGSATTILAHLRALVRRAHGHLRSLITIGALEVHLGAAQCRLAGRHIHLTPMEYRLIEALALRRDQLVTRSQLLELLYGSESEPFAKSIDRFVHNIRSKFSGVTAEKYLQTGNRAFMLTDPPGSGGTGRPG